MRIPRKCVHIRVHDADDSYDSYDSYTSVHENPYLNFNKIPISAHTNTHFLGTVWPLKEKFLRHTRAMMRTMFSGKMFANTILTKKLCSSFACDKTEKCPDVIYGGSQAMHK